ncbi:hypothetical protein ACKLNO_06455 [Neisseriaceae bacterium B1]
MKFSWLFKSYCIYAVLQFILSYLFVSEHLLGTFLTNNFMVFLLLFAFYKLEKNNHSENRQIILAILGAGLGAHIVRLLIAFPSFKLFMILNFLYFIPFLMVFLYIKNKEKQA